MRFATLLAAAVLAFSFAGCASYDARVERGQDLGDYQRFFIQDNLDDNQGVATMITRSIQARGREAEQGPLTMLPRSAQALVTFQDRWTWDFKNHMVALRIVIQDAKSRRVLASASFTGPASLTVDAPDVVERLINDLFGPRTTTTTIPAGSVGQ